MDYFLSRRVEDKGSYDLKDDKVGHVPEEKKGCHVLAEKKGCHDLEEDKVGHVPEEDNRSLT